ncbi:MAG: hypothetical protein KGL39_18670 [Patescibacteria group bacterium]|nr:hypothetical protein [Patescibacteria group bacterium]
MTPSHKADRERLRKAIDDMEKTEVCLDIFDRAIASREAAVLEEVIAEGAKWGFDCAWGTNYQPLFMQWLRQQAKVGGA